MNDPAFVEHRNSCFARRSGCRRIFGLDAERSQLGSPAASECSTPRLRARTARKLNSYAAFRAGVGLLAPAESAASPGGRQLPRREFVEKRRAFLMRHPEIGKVAWGT